MLNHDCTPGATWHCIDIGGGSGGAIEVAAVRDIKKDDEIYVSYVPVVHPEAKRRGIVEGFIGKMCECSRCVQEREAVAKGGKMDAAFDVGKMIQDILDAQTACSIRREKSLNPVKLAPDSQSD